MYNTQHTHKPRVDTKISQEYNSIFLSTFSLTLFDAFFSFLVDSVDLYDSYTLDLCRDLEKKNEKIINDRLFEYSTVRKLITNF